MIVVLCPSRGNPMALREAYIAFHETKIEDSVFVGVIDGDDPLLPKYVEAAEDTHLMIDVVPKAEIGNMNRALNWGARRWANRKNVSMVGFIGDDHRFRTKGWDRVISDVVAGEGLPQIVYGNDLGMGASLPTQVFISSEIIKALGWMGLPGARHLYLDNTWKVLGDRADRLIYLPDIVIEHMHPHFGKGEWDENHLRVNLPEVYAHDKAIFDAWLKADMEMDVATVRALT